LSQSPVRRMGPSIEGSQIFWEDGVLSGQEGPQIGGVLLQEIPSSYRPVAGNHYLNPGVGGPSLQPSRPLLHIAPGVEEGEGGLHRISRQENPPLRDEADDCVGGVPWQGVKLKGQPGPEFDHELVLEGASRGHQTNLIELFSVLVPHFLEGPGELFRKPPCTLAMGDHFLPAFAQPFRSPDVVPIPVTVDYREGKGRNQFPYTHHIRGPRESIPDHCPVYSCHNASPNVEVPQFGLYQPKARSKGGDLGQMDSLRSMDLSLPNDGEDPDDGEDPGERSNGQIEPTLG